MCGYKQPQLMHVVQLTTVIFLFACRCLFPSFYDVLDNMCGCKQPQLMHVVQFTTVLFLFACRCLFPSLYDVLDNMISINEQIQNNMRGSMSVLQIERTKAHQTLAMTKMPPCMKSGKADRRNSTRLKMGMLQFHSEIQVENLMIPLAGGSLKEHFDTSI